MPRSSSVLRCPALRIHQGGAHPVYSFSLTGDELLRVAAIDRLGRNAEGRLVGYQRPAVRRHIQNIVEYLNSEEVLFPNAVILALSTRARFKPSRGQNGHHTVYGLLEIPLPRPDEEATAFIVDGQQRTLALSKSRRRDRPVPVNAFIADEPAVQRDQFLRINSAKPLPRSLITELLPEIRTPLPRHLAVNRAPSLMVELLNNDPESPFHGLIRRPSLQAGQRRRAVVTDSSLIRMLRESFHTPGACLFWHKSIALNRTDVPGARRVLFVYWDAVRHTFPEAWGLPPSRSRLMHGVGIRAMGRLMDRIMIGIDANDDRAYAAVRAELAKVAPHCAWTRGTWEGLGYRWNDLQNVPAHVRMLSDFIVQTYLDAA